ETDESEPTEEPEEELETDEEEPTEEFEEDQLLKENDLSESIEEPEPDEDGVQEDIDYEEEKGVEIVINIIVE
ncbi:MAG: hypothetical protein ACQES9_11990, partial [Myxococcota bacterium]